MAFLNVLVHLIPVPVLIGIGVIIAMVVLFAVAAHIASRAAERREEELRLREKEKARVIRERAAAVKRQQEENDRRKKQEPEQRAAAEAAVKRREAGAKRREEEQDRQQSKRLVEALGKQGVAFMTRARSSVQRIGSTEAARSGWLGDIDFTPDIEEIETNLRQARALRSKSDELSALTKPNEDDRTILAQAKTTTAQLERQINERVKLLEKCASGAVLIDESLRRERDEIQVAAKREELHGELAALLYLSDAPKVTPAESAADGVIARVQAYKDIKGQIERARIDAELPADTKNEPGEAPSASWIPTPLRDAWKWVAE